MKLSTVRRLALARGLTLVELLIVIAVAAVLLMLAAPGFNDLLLKQRLRGVHAQLVTDLQLARTEAVSRGVVVNVALPLNDASAPMTCYIIFVDKQQNYPLLGASDACDCRQPEGSRCTGDRIEVRTVQIPRSRGVSVSLPPTQTTAVAFDPVTGGMLLTRDEQGRPTGNPFTVFATVDGSRRLAAIVGVSGRPTSCSPAGSVMGGAAC